MLNLKKLVDDFNENYELKEFITEYTGAVFKKSGKNWLTNSPFNQSDKTPSFTISFNKPYLFYCFSTKKAGNIISFISEYDEISKEDAGIALIKNLKWKIEDYTIDKERYDLNKVHAYFLAEQHRGLEYLEHRGITDLTMPKNEGVGFYSGEIETDLFAEYGGVYLLKDSVTVPIRDWYGRITGFVQRRVSGEKQYMNVSMSDGVLFYSGLDKISPAIDRTVIFVEGVFDRYTILAKYGYKKNIVAMCGTKLEPSLVDKLKSDGYNDIVVWVDGDVAGSKFAIGLLETGYSLPIKILQYQELDPDDIIKYGGDIQLNDAVSLPIYVSRHNDYVYADSIDLLTKLQYHYFYDYMLYIEQKFQVARDIIMMQVGHKTDMLYDASVELQVVSNMVADKTLVAKFDMFRDVFSKKYHRVYDHIVSDNNLEPRYAYRDKEYVDLMESLPIPTQHTAELYSKLKDLYTRRRFREKFLPVLTNIASVQVDEISEYVEVESSDGGVIDGRSAAIDVVSSLLNRDLVSPKLHLGREWNTLMSVTGGFSVGNLIIVTGITGHGKSHMLYSWVRILALYAGHAGVVFSGEMSNSEIMIRILSYETGIDSQRLNVSGLDDSAVVNIAEHIKSKSFNNIMLSSDLSYSSIINTIKLMHRKHKIKWVGIDYAQLVGFSNDKNTLRENLIQMTKTLKALAVKLGIVIILVAQQSDAARDDATPEARRIAEAKAMLNDADIAIAIRKKTDKEIEFDGIAKGNVYMHLDKVRNGRSNTLINVVMDSVTQKMSECDIRS